MFSYKLTTDDQEVGVKRIVTLKDRHRVAVGLENGRIFLVRSDMSPLAPTMGEGSFVMSELGSSTILFDFIAVNSNKYVDKIDNFILFHYLCVIELGLVNYGVEKTKVVYLYTL